MTRESTSGGSVYISELWRYPVKSLRGERCEHVQVRKTGLEGDRRYALVNAEGKLGSHKSSRRFTKMPGLFELAATCHGGETHITMGCGQVVKATDPRVHEALSNHVGQPVRCVAESGVSHQDAAAVHILTRASLRWLSERVDTVDVRRFRPNLVIETPGDERTESDWIGKTVYCGGVELLITQPTARCIMTILAQEELPKNPEILRVLASEAAAHFGVYARVLRTGELRVGDAVTVR